MTTVETLSDRDIETNGAASVMRDSAELPVLSARGREFLTILNDVFDSLTPRVTDEPTA